MLIISLYILEQREGELGLSVEKIIKFRLIWSPKRRVRTHAMHKEMWGRMKLEPTESNATTLTKLVKFLYSNQFISLSDKGHWSGTKSVPPNE